MSTYLHVSTGIKLYVYKTGYLLRLIPICIRTLLFDALKFNGTWKTS